jgi:hypothetical protein
LNDPIKNNMRGAGHVVRTGRGELFTRFCWRSFREKEDLENPVVDGRIILNCHFKKKDVGCGLDRSESGQGQVPCYCDSGNELSGSIKCGEFLE